LWCFVNELFGFVAVNCFLFAGRSKFAGRWLFAGIKFIDRLGRSFHLLGRNPDKTFLFIQQIGHFAGFTVDNSGRLRRRIHAFFVPFDFDGDFPSLAWTIDFLHNREIGARADKRNESNYRIKSGKIPHGCS